MFICISQESYGTFSQLPYKDLCNGEILAVTYIKEDCVSVGISIMPINAIESLGELDITHLLSNLGIHQETHGLPRSFAVVDIVITVQVQHERSIGKHSRDTNLKIHKALKVAYKSKYL